MKKWQKRFMMEKCAVREVDLRKHTVKNTGERAHKKHEDPQRVCMKRLMTVDVAKEVCRDCNVWRSVLSDYPAYSVKKKS